MFNDGLTRAQCERLVAQLARTAFPFQCAHGRPSVVPLAGVPTSSGSRGDRARPVDWQRFREARAAGTLRHKQFV
jgi:DNA mismatch repair protein MLH3